MGQDVPDFIEAGEDERASAVRVVHVAGTVPDIEDLPGLCYGTEQRIVAPLSFRVTLANGNDDPLFWEVLEHGADGCETALQFGLACGGGSKVAAISTFMNLDARDVDLSAGKHERVSGGSALEGAAAAFLAGTWLGHGGSLAQQDRSGGGSVFDPGIIPSAASGSSGFS